MNTQLNNILKDLEQQGWSVQEHFFDNELIQQLSETLNSLQQQGDLQRAGIGRKKDFHIEQTIRSDEISWFDEKTMNSAQEKFLSITQQLQDAVNQQFYLGLFELEIHFALYPVGACYKRHLDQHKNQDTRVLTLITYLNEDWNDEDGGQLQLYLKNGETVSISPNAGKLVCFFSAEYEHEVLPAKRERASLTGWFRKRPAM